MFDKNLLIKFLNYKHLNFIMHEKKSKDKLGRKLSNSFNEVKEEEVSILLVNKSRPNSSTDQQ